MERNEAADVPKYGTADHLTKIPFGKSHLLRDRLCLVATLPPQQNAGRQSENEVDGQVNERKPGWVRYGREVHDPAYDRHCTVRRSWLCAPWSVHANSIRS